MKITLANNAATKNRRDSKYNFPAVIPAFRFIYTLLARYLLLFLWIVWPVGSSNLRHYIVRFLLLGCGALLFIVIQFINLLAHLLDEVLFRGYRKTRISNPVFIVGAPRSGTTYVHRTVAKDSTFTTTSAVDCLLTPSVTQRKLLGLVIRLDTLAGRPLAKLVKSVQSPLVKKISANHEFSLHEAEEDFLLLTPLLQCFLLVLPFPKSQWLWEFACADKNPDSIHAKLTLRWYRMCVRKHLFCNPQAKRYLSKNPTFSGIANLLAEMFPDSQLIVCERDAPTAVRSQFRVLAPLRGLLSGRKNDGQFNTRLLDTLLFYYSNLDTLKMSLPASRVRTASLWQLSVRPLAEFQNLLQWLEPSKVDTSLAPTVVLRHIDNAKNKHHIHHNSYNAPADIEAAIDNFIPWQAPEEQRI